MHRKNERQKKLYERIAELCEVPQDLVSNIPVFTIRGKHEIEISGCTGILIYDSGRIVLSVGNDNFTVVGDKLTLSDFRQNILYVRGNIKSAYFGADEIKEG